MSTRLIIDGQVQGVGYRYALAERATALKLSGWVRNRRNGTVEACVDGAAAHVDKLVEWAHRGPPAAVVTSVVATPSAEIVASHSGGFEILPTY